METQKYKWADVRTDGRNERTDRTNTPANKASSHADYRTDRPLDGMGSITTHTHTHGQTAQADIHKQIDKRTYQANWQAALRLQEDQIAGRGRRSPQVTKAARGPPWIPESEKMKNKHLT